MDEIHLLRNIVSCLDSVRLGPGGITATHLNALPFLKAKLSVDGRVIGIRKEAGEATYDLADKIFTGSNFYRRGTTFDALFNELSDIIIERFWGQSIDKIDASDVAFVEARTEDWFRAHATAHRLYVPCILSPRPAPSFDVGPINFTHIDDFAARERPVVGRFFDQAFKRVFETMNERSAAWIATVEVQFSTKERAWELGELAVDIALAGIQLVVPISHSQNMARMTARTFPRLREMVSFGDGVVSAGGSNEQPGLAMGDGLFEAYLTQGNAVIKAAGPRISTFLSGSGQLPMLEQAWVDAAYWFHEGLAEPLDTIAVPKLETAIEVLLRAESSTGSERRLLHAIRAFYGLKPDQFINPQSLITVKQFAKGFVRDRSRILHGTWSTLASHLRDSRPSLTVLVHGLLKNYILELEHYASAAEVSDKLDDFLKWVEDRRGIPVMVAPEAPAQS
jgi:hypothetical protein